MKSSARVGSRSIRRQISGCGFPALCPSRLCGFVSGPFGFVFAAPLVKSFREVLGELLSQIEAAVGLQRRLGISVLIETAAGMAPQILEVHIALARAYARPGRKADADRANAVFRALDEARLARHPGRPRRRQRSRS